MSLELGKPIVDLESGEARFRLVELLARGEHYDIAVGEDTHLDDKQVAIKAIRYPDDEHIDPASVQARRHLLHDELRVLTMPFSLLPEPLDWLTIENSEDFPDDAELAESEPLLVYELQHGRTLREKVASVAEVKGEGGVALRRALRIVEELALFLRGIHARGRILRGLSPDHVILDVDDIVHVIGLGGTCAIGAPVSAAYREREDPYVAPELRVADNPQFVQPAADIYSLGALLTHLLTGRDPLLVVESPFDDATFHLLGQHGPGIAKLIARMMHADPNRRFGSAGAVLSHLDPRQTPDPEHEDFDGVELPSPWGQTPAGGPKSSLSPGPLVSKPKAPAADSPPATRPASEDAIARRHRRIAIAFASTAVISVIIVVLLAILV